MIESNINLSQNQITKIRSAFKKHKPVRIKLSYKKISGEGKHRILLTETQKKRLDRSLRLGKGLVLELNNEQLRINHSGGFLPLIFAGLGALGALLGGGAAVANTVIQSKHKQSEEDEMKRHNAEMEKIASGRAAIKNIKIGSGLPLKKTIKINLTDNQINTIKSIFEKHKHTGGFVQLIIPIATALGTLIAGGFAIAKTVSDVKHKKVEEEELKRHNQEMEKIAQNAKFVSIGSGLKKKKFPAIK
jgi:hypothetical protein